LGVDKFDIGRSPAISKLQLILTVTSERVPRNPLSVGDRIDLAAQQELRPPGEEMPTVSIRGPCEFLNNSVPSSEMTYEIDRLRLH